MMEKIKELIEVKYDIKVEKIEKIKNAYKIEAEEGSKCFKLSKYDIGQFKFIVASINHLIENGFESVLPIIKTKDGESFIGVDSSYGFLCEWINSREADFKNPVELKMCVDTLSHLHAASRGFTSPKESKGRNYYGKWVKKFRKRCDELLYFKALLKSKDEQTDFDRIYLKYFDSHYRQALKTINDLESSKYFEIMEKHREFSGLCHHDTANHNFLITPDMKMYMIDFDYCIQDSHIHDLSSIIIRNLKYGHWNLYTMEYILNIYSSRIGIDRDEFYLVYCFMQFPQDFWQVGLQYYVEKQPWGEEFFVKKLNRITEDSRERMDFIKELEASLMEGYDV